MRLRMEAWVEAEKEWGGGRNISHKTDKVNNPKRTFLSYQKIIGMDNLLEAWREFLSGKRKRKDVAEFATHLMDNVLALHQDLVNKTYRHGGYASFKINDPKPRDIHKAMVRDRLLHHAIYRILYPYFDTKFIFYSFSCRRGKGVYEAINWFRDIGRKVSRNNTRTVWVLKCDIKKFFANIDHTVLKNILAKNITDKDVLWLLNKVIDSFHIQGNSGIGLPLGNLTSQLLVNVYMNVFDYFLKRELKVGFYIRYADDFVILHKDRKYLEDILPPVSLFLEKCLKLSLHPDKVFIKTLASGLDFLGWIHFPQWRVLRISTKKRMFFKLKHQAKECSIASYFGLLKHGDAFKLQQKLGKRLINK